MRDDRISRRDLLCGRLLRRGLLGAIEGVSEALGAARSARDRTEIPGTQHSSASREHSRSARTTVPIHRPPGAVDEASFLAGCTRCGDCIRACPANAIVLAPARFRDAAGTPMIDPSVAPCVMCDGSPCISACEPGVLRPDHPIKMASAFIQKSACLAWNGSFCSVCAERCPVPGAIAVDSGRPTITDATCTGCGVCAFVCPAPGSAIVIMPLEDRPRRDPATQSARRTDRIQRSLPG